MRNNATSLPSNNVIKYLTKHVEIFIKKYHPVKINIKTRIGTEATTLENFPEPEVNNQSILMYFFKVPT